MSDPVENWVESYYADVDAMRLERYLAWHDPQVRMQFARSSAITGVEAIGERMRDFWALIDGLEHTFAHVWHHDDGWTVVEASIDYRRKDGGVVTVPCVTLLHRPATLVNEVRVFMDGSAILA